MPVLTDEQLAEIYEQAFRAGETFERVRWYWQARNTSAMIVAGYPPVRPVRPPNPFKEN